MPRPLPALFPVLLGLLLAGAPAGPAVAAQVPPVHLPPGPPATAPPPGTAGLVRPPDSPGIVPDPFGWISDRVREAVNGWFRDLAASALQGALDLAGRTLLATPDLASPRGRVAELWRASQALANAAYALLITIGGLLVMTHGTLHSRYTLKEVAPRLVVGAVAANTSLAVVGWGVELANATSRALLDQRLDPGRVSELLRRLAIQPLDAGAPVIVLLALVAAALGLVLVATWIVRVALLAFLTAAAPVALACHGLPQTEGLARLWWRAVAACLGVQAAQALLLVTAVRVFFQADRASVLGLPQAHLVDLLVCCCLLWLLVRVPVWAARAVFTPRCSVLVRMAKSYVILRVVRAARGVAA